MQIYLSFFLESVMGLEASLLTFLCFDHFDKNSFDVDGQTVRRTPLGMNAAHQLNGEGH
jgi:hypothetical protein